MLFSLAMLAFMLIDPALFKLDVARYISAGLGREVRISGPVEYDFFPWLGITAHDVRVENPAHWNLHAASKDENNQPFISAKRVAIRVKLTPLILLREVEFDRIELDTPRILLGRDKQGRATWDGLFKEKQGARPKPVSAPTTNGRPTKLTVRQINWSGLDIINGSVLWRDEIADEEWYVSDLIMDAEQDLEFDYSLSFHVLNERRRLEARVALTGECAIGAAPFNVDMRNGELKVRGRFVRLNKDGASGVAKRGPRSRINGLEVTSRFQIYDLFQDNARIIGDLNLDAIDPGKLFGPNIPAALEKMLEKPKLSFSYQAKNNEVKLTNVRASVTGMSLRGGGVLTWADAGARLEAELDCDRVDIEAIIDAATPANTPERAPDEIVDVIDESLALFLPWPKDWPDAKVSLQVARLPLWDAQIRGVKAELDIKDGRARLKTDARALKGVFHGTLVHTKKGLELDAELRNGDIALLGRLIGTPFGQGPASARLKAKGDGSSIRSILQHFSATGDAWLEKNGELLLAGKSPAGAKKERHRLRMKGVSLELSARNEGRVWKLRDFPLLVSMKGAATHTWSENKSVWKGKTDFDVKGAARMDWTDPKLLSWEKGRFRTETHAPLPWISSASHAKKSMQTRLGGGVTYQRAKRRLAFRDVTVATPKVRAKVSLELDNVTPPGQDDEGKPVWLAGGIGLSAFSPKEALKAFGWGDIETHAKNALTRCSVSAEVSGSFDKLVVEDFFARVDETDLSGRLEFGNLRGKGALEALMDVAGDKMNLDAYRAPHGEDGRPTAAQKTKKWNLKPLHALNLTANVGFGALRWLDLDHENVSAQVNIRNGALHMKSLAADFYGGDMKATGLARDMGPGKGLEYSLDARLSKFALDRVLKELGGDENVGGSATLKVDLAGHGQHSEGMLRSLSGKCNFVVEAGFVGLPDLPAPSESTRGMLISRNTENQGPRRAFFPKATATFDVKNGVVTNKDFILKSQELNAKGHGSAILPKGELDYKVTIRLAGAPTLPMRIHGPIWTPKVEVEGAGMLTDTFGRVGVSAFSFVGQVLTLPFRALGTLARQADPNSRKKPGEKREEKREKKLSD